MRSNSPGIPAGLSPISPAESLWPESEAANQNRADAEHRQDAWFGDETREGEASEAVHHESVRRRVSSGEPVAEQN